MQRNKSPTPVRSRNGRSISPNAISAHSESEFKKMAKETLKRLFKHFEILSAPPNESEVASQTRRKTLKQICRGLDINETNLNGLKGVLLMQ